MNWIKCFILALTLVVVSSDGSFRNDCRRPCKRCSDCVNEEKRRLNNVSCPSELKDNINCLMGFVPAVDVDID